MLEATPHPPDDINNMKIALADAITKWAELEDCLALFLAAALGTEANFGPLIYFAPAAIETRLAILDAVLSLYLKAEPCLWQFIPIWAALLGKLNAARQTRNAIAHGAVITLVRVNTATVRLAGPRFHPRNQMKKGQLPGMSLHDVRAAYIRFQHCISAASHMTATITAFRESRVTIEALHEIALELEAHLKTGSAQLGALTSPVDSGQSPPSPG